MFAILYAIGMFVADLFKSRSRLEAEILFLRYQLTLALRDRSGLAFADFLRHAVAATPPTAEVGGGNQQNSLVATATYFAQPWPMFRCRCRYSDP
jgi:hypothetical protein